jgi:hypothetical protein
MKNLIPTIALIASCLAANAGTVTLTVNNQYSLGRRVLKENPLVIGEKETATILSIYGPHFAVQYTTLSIIKDGITNSPALGYTIPPLHVAGPAIITYSILPQNSTQVACGSITVEVIPNYRNLPMKQTAGGYAR